MTVNARELLDAATPRPWAFHRGYLNGGGGQPICRVATETLGEVEASAASAPLLLAAVNEYEALLGLESSVRSRVVDHPRNCDCALCFRLNALDALRADLSSVNDQGRPHSQQERAGSPDRKDDTQ